jgi:hypothetical protein
MFVKFKQFDVAGSPEVFEQKLETQAGILEQVRADYLAKKKQIEDDRNLSTTGKQSKLKELQAQVSKSLAGLEIDEALSKARGIHQEKMLEAYRQQAERSKIHPVLAYLQDKEIRDHIASLDPAHRELTIRQQIEAGNSEWFWAVKSDPIPGRVASPGFVAEMTAIQAERFAPDDAAMVRNIGTLERAKAANVNMLKNELGISTVDDWVSRLASQGAAAESA